MVDPSATASPRHPGTDAACIDAHPDQQPRSPMDVGWLPSQLADRDGQTHLQAGRPQWSGLARTAQACGRLL